MDEAFEQACQYANKTKEELSYKREKEPGIYQFMFDTSDDDYALLVVVKNGKAIGSKEVYWENFYPVGWLLPSGAASEYGE